MSLRVGIVGYGVVGKTRHKALDKHPDFTVVAISDIAFKDNNEVIDGIETYTDYMSLIESAEVEVLFISLPNKLASEATLSGLKKGRNVFCEKPPARSLAELYPIKVYLDEHPNLKLMYGFNHRFHASIMDANKIVRAGTLGKLLNLRGIYGKSNMISFNQTDWRTDRAESGGGILLDQGIHMLDLMRYLSGESFSEIFSFIDNAFWNFDVEDNAYVLMKSSNGVVAQLHSSATQWRHVFNLEITLQKGSLVLGGLLTGSKSYGDETLNIISSNPTKDKGAPLESTSKYNEDVSWDNEIKYFANCLKNNLTIERGSIEDAIETMRLVEAIYKADPQWKKKYYS